MKEYDDKQICTSGHYSGKYMSDRVVHYGYGGVIFGFVSLVRKPFGENWNYSCVIELEYEQGRIVGKRFLPFSLQ